MPRGNGGVIDPIDLHVGARVRERRRELHISQGDVGGCLGVSLAQQQKYECGRNRISASMLWRIAQRLGVAPGYFFEGLS